ncbi:MAG: LysM peptidoglycan-binding domain-containing protein [Anaerolineales bacterium]
MRRLLLVTLMILAALLASVPALNAQSTPCTGTLHTVQTGETLSSIARQYGTTLNTLIAANNIPNPDRILIAQQLCIPGDVGGGTGGPLAQVPTGQALPGPSTANATTGNTTTVSGPVFVNTNRYVVNRPAGSVEVTVPAGTVDSQSGATTTASIGLDATNNLLHVQSGGMIPNSWANVYVSSELGDASGRAGLLQVDANGRVDGYVAIPRLAGVDRHYVMIRSYDGRMTFGYFNLNPLTRFP